MNGSLGIVGWLEVPRLSGSAWLVIGLGAAGTAVVLIWAGVRIGLAWAAWRRARAVRRHHRIGQRGEQAAERLLRAAGYRVQAAQVELWSSLSSTVLQSVFG